MVATRPDLGPRQEAEERGSSEGHQGADAQGEPVVEEGGVGMGRRGGRAFLAFFRVLLQVGQLEAAAEQQVEELRLWGREAPLGSTYAEQTPSKKKIPKGS